MGGALRDLEIRRELARRREEALALVWVLGLRGTDALFPRPLDPTGDRPVRVFPPPIYRQWFDSNANGAF
jgi:hypothetical protein